MSRPLRLVILGTVASNPYAGIAWMHMMPLLGLLRLGHDAYYLETTSTWPYDPVRDYKVSDDRYAVPYLARVAEGFGVGDRWAYRRSYSDDAWVGPVEAAKAEELLAHADAVLSVAGATRLEEEGLDVGRLVYVGTDPVYHEVTYSAGLEDTRTLVDEHDDFVTFGENIGTPRSPIPPLPGQRSTTRQAVILDLWDSGPPTREVFTTVGNWKQEGREVEMGGVRYAWSKHHEYLKVIDVPRRTNQALEIAMSLATTDSISHGEGEAVRAMGLTSGELTLLREHGWRLTDSRAFTNDPWRYRDYILASRGEFTVARDLNVRLRSGWFSERSACYLAAGRPVVSQDTGFGDVLPTGAGLFAFRSAAEAAAALDAIAADYERHSRAAREIAHDYFRAETVLAKLLDDLGL